MYSLGKLCFPRREKIRLTGPSGVLNYPTASSKAQMMVHSAQYCTSQFKKATREWRQIEVSTETVVQVHGLSQKHYEKLKIQNFTMVVCQCPHDCSAASGYPTVLCMALLEVH